MQYLIIVIVFISCAGKKKTIVQNDICETLIVSNLTIDNFPFVAEYSMVVKKFGEPSVIKDSCANTAVLYKQGFNSYACLEFANLPGVIYKLIADTAFVYSVDFDKCDSDISINGEVIDTTLNIRELIANCDNIKNRVNKGKSLEAILNNYDYIELEEKTDLRNKPRTNKLEMLFSSSNLKLIYYDWQPAYSENEWKNFIKVKDIITK